MFPIIYKIGPITIYSYGFMLAVAALLCSFLLAKEAKKKGIHPDIIYDLIFWVVLGGILGARLFFIFLNFDYYLSNPFEAFMLQRGGLAWQGGLIVGFISGALFIKNKKQSLLKIIDLCAPYGALGQSIGRIGCFLNGCCYGRHSDFGIYFPVHHDKMIPTQLFDAVGLFILYLLLKRYQRSNVLSGSVFISYLFGASVLRFIIEFFRADHSELILGLSIFQVISLFIVIISIYAYTQLNCRQRAK